MARRISRERVEAAKAPPAPKLTPSAPRPRRQPTPMPTFQHQGVQGETYRPWAVDTSRAGLGIKRGGK